MINNRYIEVDMNSWKRALHCQIFRVSIEPSYCITLELDITNFLLKIKEQNYSFTFS